MKATAKFEASPMVSNLLLGLAVVAAATPVLLGDRLVPMVSDAITQSTVILQSVSLSLQRLLS
ncbi:MAG TPA: hypothetical protein VFR80_03685 [Pyrinomonadaceae bacterium]|nr:hypothetical protein [Pyrinomonadaceae bacterium]